MKKNTAIQGIVLSLFFFSLPVFAQVENAGQSRQVTEKEGPEEVGNKICPVSGEKIKEAEAYKVEYKGKIYNLCCKMCKKDFEKDPEKYIKRLEALEEQEHIRQGHSHEGQHKQ